MARWPWATRPSLFWSWQVVLPLLVTSVTSLSFNPLSSSPSSSWSSLPQIPKRLLFRRTKQPSDAFLSTSWFNDGIDEEDAVVPHRLANPTPAGGGSSVAAAAAAGCCWDKAASLGSRVASSARALLRPLARLISAAASASAAPTPPLPPSSPSVSLSLRSRARRGALRTLGLLSATMAVTGRVAWAIGGGGAAKASNGLPTYSGSLVIPVALWVTLFILSASLHAAEISITTLYPWKVKEFAEEEGPTSPFQTLDDDITRVLTTVLVLTTVCQVVSTMLFTIIVSSLPQVSFSQATLFLTFFTLFFGELVPKALGVANAEGVARTTVPAICVLAVFFSPIGLASTWLTKRVLAVFGIESGEMGVSEEELRLIVMGAKQSGGIETEEAKMVEGVLDLQDMRVSEVMKPRINVEALEANATLVEFMELVNTTKYSRIPVYDTEIDQIMGVAIAKDLLVYALEGPEALGNVTVRQLMEPTYFVPEFMVVQKVLEEMRRRRVHMAIVVDEYGGTAGVVTLEDILEEVVGEIYDEGDEQEEAVDEDNIMLLDDGRFELRGIADIDDVCLALGLSVNEGDENRRDIGTISGFLCDQAGEIPLQGDVIIAEGFAFTVTEADERRILLVHAESIENLEARSAGNRGNNGNGQSLDDDRARDGGGEGQSDVDFSVPSAPANGNGNGGPTIRAGVKEAKRKWLPEDGYVGNRASSAGQLAAEAQQQQQQDVFDGVLPS